MTAMLSDATPWKSAALICRSSRVFIPVVSQPGTLGQQSGMLRLARRRCWNQRAGHTLQQGSTNLAILAPVPCAQRAGVTTGRQVAFDTV